MKTKMKLLVALFFVATMAGYSQQNVALSLLKNVNISYGYNKTDTYKWTNMGIGTQYGENIRFLPKAYWAVLPSVNYSSYTFYNSSYFGSGDVSTTSIALPFIVGYRLLQTQYLNLNVYTGPHLEYIFYSNSDNDNLKDVERFQAGWRVGANISLMRNLGLTVSYAYYPTKLYRHGDFTRDSFSVSLGVGF
ncbi:MAG: hypothetical protein CR965_01525 [Paludibacter sp.]|nr:MAG: hypothetical protein CR965_01525 [Paludibacter sp.]